MGFCRRPARIDHLYTVGFAGGDGKISAPNTPEKGTAFLLEPVLVFFQAAVLLFPISAAGALDAETDFIIEKDSQVRLQITAKDLVQLQHWLAAQSPSRALVGLGRIREAITKHDAPLSQCGQNHFLNVLGTGGKHQSHFGQWREAGSRGVQQHFANLLAGGSAAGFARDSDGNAMGPQRTGQFLDLRALAAAIEAFKRNKLPAWGHAGNDSRIMS